MYHHLKSSLETVHQKDERKRKKQNKEKKKGNVLQQARGSRRPPNDFSETAGGLPNRPAVALASAARDKEATRSDSQAASIPCMPSTDMCA